MAAYRSAQGKMIDMSQMVARNEKVRAVGNMNVNARGDIIDSNNRIIQDNTKRVKNSYQKAVAETVQQRATRSPLPQQQQPQQQLQNIPIIEDIKPELLSTEKEFFDDDEDIIK